MCFVWQMPSVFVVTFKKGDFNHTHRTRCRRVTAPALSVTLEVTLLEGDHATRTAEHKDRRHLPNKAHTLYTNIQNI